MEAVAGAEAAPPPPLAGLARLVAAVAAAPEAAREVVACAAADLRTMLGAVPDHRFGADWAALAADMAADLPTDPAAVLADWQAILAYAARRSKARGWISSPGGQQADSLAAQINAVVARLPASGAPLQPRTERPAVPAWRRWLPVQRSLGAALWGGAQSGRLVGFVHPRLAAGAVVSMAACAGAGEESSLGQDALLDTLALMQLAGGGAHSLFMRTWGAGLAYSNGLAASLADGRARYYADTCPDVARTLAFAAAEVRGGNTGRRGGNTGRRGGTPGVEGQHGLGRKHWAWGGSTGPGGEHRASGGQHQSPTSPASQGCTAARARPEAVPSCPCAQLPRRPCCRAVWQVARDLAAAPVAWRADYALAQCFTSRAGTASPEARAEAAAADNADGRSPERVRALRLALLALREMGPQALSAQLHARMRPVLSKARQPSRHLHRFPAACRCLHRKPALWRCGKRDASRLASQALCMV